MLKYVISAYYCIPSCFCVKALNCVIETGMCLCSCGNLNFARRVECNKCGAPSPAGASDRNASGGSGGYNRGGSGGGFGGNRGGRGDGGRANYDGGRGTYEGRSGGGNRGSSYGGSQGREDTSYGHVPPSSYPGASGNYPPANSYGGNTNYEMDAVPPPTSYTGGPTSYPPSYGGPVGGYGGDSFGDAGGGSRAGPPAAYDSGYGGGGPRYQGGSYSNAPADTSAKVKQCDGNCDSYCDNSRIYISNLPPDVTVDELRELFGGIGTVISHPFPLNQSFWFHVYFMSSLKRFCIYINAFFIMHLSYWLNVCLSMLPVYHSIFWFL